MDTNFISAADSALRARADEKYREFTERLVRTKFPIIGVRMPVIRKLAVGFRADEVDFSACPRSHEEVLLRGFILGKTRYSEEFFARVVELLEYVDNWATCDSLCAALKQIKNRREEAWQTFSPFIHSDEVFKRRFFVVMLNDYYLDAEWMGRALDALAATKRGDYCGDMAVAWAYATAAAKDFYAAKTALSKESGFVLKNSVAKARDSYRLTPEQKLELKSLIK